MKLVQMPRELPTLGVDERLLAGFEGYLSRAVDDQVGLLILGGAENASLMRLDF